MRRLTAALIVAAVCLPLITEAEDAPAEAPSSRHGWPVIVLDKPFHVGDQTMRQYKQPKPMGREFKAGFELDEVPLAVYVTIRVSYLMHPKDKKYRGGAYQTKLLINASEVAVLNEKLPRRPGKDGAAEVVVRVQNRHLKKGANELIVRGGGLGDNTNDFELHGIELHNRQPRR